MKIIGTALFALVLAFWCGLEFWGGSEWDGLKDILFWVGMGCVLLAGYSQTARPKA